jgi:23S rRNA (uracil1939-C5)-methyltransferase
MAPRGASRVAALTVRDSATARVRIESIAAGGDGIGRADGLAVFVPRTAPGDLVETSLRMEGRLARGRVLHLEEPGADRVEPPCPHYVRDRCGGCQLQHLSGDAQRAAKAAIVHDAMQRIGHREVPAPDVVASPAPWRYREKLTLALRRRGDGWIGGLHPYDDPSAVFALEDCPITDERVVAIWRAILDAGALLPDARSLRGAVRWLSDSASFVLEGGRTWRTAERLAERVPRLSAIWWIPEHGKRRLVVDRRAGEQPGASFAQVNPQAAALLHAHVVERALVHAPATLVDAYAGAGATAVPLAERGVRVTAIELDPEAGAWTRRHLAPPSRAVAARVEDVLARALPADVVLLNPPRAGVHERVTATLRAAGGPVKAIVYVSCNPATLARDVARLDTWRVAAIRAFDLFPQTAHVETVCELVPEAA